MAYLLEFPPSTLPDNIRAPPYVIFGINGISVVNQLPKLIPLNAVLYFVPKLAQYVLLAPENLPADAAQGVLRTPFVGIDVLLDIGIAAFQRIIMRVLQSAGMAVPKHQLHLPPTTITSTSIRKTWLLLELPTAGLDGLRIHVQTRLMMGPSVTFTEMKELWAAFPSDSDMLRVMTVNFVQSHLAFNYTMEEFSSIRRWYNMDKERHLVFTAAEEQFPEFGKMLSIRSSEPVIFNRMPLAESRRMAKKRDDLAAEEMAAMAVLSKRLEALEKKTKAKEARKVDSFEERQKIPRLPKARKYKSAPDLNDEAQSMDDMTAKLSKALRKVQLEREAESAAMDKSEEVLQPTVYDPSGAST